MIRCSRALVMAAMLCGCAAQRDTGIAISIDVPQPLDAELKPMHGDPVDGRFVLIPVGLEDSGPDFGVSYGMAATAWTGKGMSGYGYRSLNLVVVDLETRQHRQVFDRQVALGHWEQPRRPETTEPSFGSQLMLRARIADTTGDRQIDMRDEVHCFLYDLAAGTLRQVSPAGHSVEDVAVVNGRIILTVRSGVAPAALSVFRYDPRNSTGEFVAEGITP